VVVYKVLEMMDLIKILILVGTGPKELTLDIKIYGKLKLSYFEEIFIWHKMFISKSVNYFITFSGFLLYSCI
jgi:hypothetical protein